MPFKVSLVLNGLRPSINSAIEGPFACVGTHVPFQVCLTRKGLCAYITPEALFGCVDTSFISRFRAAGAPPVNVVLAVVEARRPSRLQGDNALRSPGIREKLHSIPV